MLLPVVCAADLPGMLGPMPARQNFSSRSASSLLPSSWRNVWPAVLRQVISAVPPLSGQSANPAAAAVASGSIMFIKYLHGRATRGAVELYRSNLSIEYSSQGHRSPAWMINS
jgi:hypothetical protein